MMERTILHSDLNSFYASVEMMLDPSLRGKAVAVCGATEDRHGIVLAKSDLAKKAGVKTGMRDLNNLNATARCHCALPPARRGRHHDFIKSLHLRRGCRNGERIATPVCVLARNDAD